LGSISLFIVAGKNKKGYEPFCGSQLLSGLSKTALVYKTVLSITLQIDL